MKITLIYLFMFDLPLILTGRIALLRARIFTLARPLKLRLRRDFSFSQKIWNFKQVSKIKRKEMNFHENDIRNIPSGFRSQCEIRHALQKCSICDMAAEEINGDCVYQTVPWMRQNLVPPCVWSVGRLLAEAVDPERKIDRDLVQPFLAWGQTSDISECQLLDVLMSSIATKMADILDYEKTYAAVCHKFHEITNGGILSGCGISLIPQAVALYYFCETKKDQIIETLRTSCKSIKISLYLPLGIGFVHDEVLSEIPNVKTYMAELAQFRRTRMPYVT